MLGLGGSAAAAAPAAAAGGAARGAASGPAGSGSLLPPDQSWTVTLITGDVVRVQTVSGGPPLVSVQPRPGGGNEIISKFVSASGEIEVLPEDIVPLLGRVLDPALFDVTTLIANGDDNENRSYLPLLVQGQPGQPAAAVTAAGLTLSPGTRPSAAGPVAAREPWSDAAKMGQVLDAMARAVLRPGQVNSPAILGIRHISLAQTAGTRYGAETGAPQAGATAAPTVTLTLNATPIPGTASGEMSAFAFVVNIANPELFDNEVAIGSDGSATVQVPAGRYWISGNIGDFTNPDAPRTAWVGQPEATVSGNTTVALDGADTVPITASVAGHPTVMTSAGFHVQRVIDGEQFGGLLGGDIYALGGSNVANELFAQPTGTASTGTFNVAADFQLSSPSGPTQPYVYDLYHPLGNHVPQSLAYTATASDQATFARFNEQFYAVGGNTAPVQEVRYGLTSIGAATGGLTVEDVSTMPGGSTLTQYLSTGPGIRWSDEAAPPLTGQNDGLWVIELPGFFGYSPGSQHTVEWARQPFRPGPYSHTTPTFEGCSLLPTVRFPGAIDVQLTDLQDVPDGYDCLRFVPTWLQATSRTMQLYRGSKLIATKHTSIANFLVPEAPDTYRLVYTDNTSAALPVSTQTQTTWTFRSAAPPGGNVVRIPLLLVGYSLPLNLDNQPDGSTAVFTVARVAGTPPAPVTGFWLWTSLDNGQTWQAARVRPLGGGRFAAALPQAASGQAVALRVQATDAGGSDIDQTIMTAYNG
jgi:hypothetical protein